MTDAIASDLQRYLQQARDTLVGSLDGLSEYDVRRPLTPTGTNLLGLVKHLAGLELGSLGDCVGRPAPVTADSGGGRNTACWPAYSGRS